VSAELVVNIAGRRKMGEKPREREGGREKERECEQIRKTMSSAPRRARERSW
jgi:hypothetical protein